MKRALIAAILLLVSASAAAWDVRLSGGVSSANSWSYFSGDAGAAEASLLVGNWDLTSGWIGDQRDVVDNFAYFSVQRVIRIQAAGGTPFIGLGGAIRTKSDNIDLLLPEAVNFSISLGFEFGRASIQARHMSNGGLGDSPNRGNNWLLAGWRF